MLSRIWTAFLVLALAGGICTGRMSEVSAAAAAGAEEAVKLLLGLTGMMALWSGVMRVLSASGVAELLARLFRPVLRPLFGKAGTDQTCMELVSANVTANLLGLSNAATPIGLQAAGSLYDRAGRRGAPDSVLTLIVLNTTSLQLIPTTVAAIRVQAGVSDPFDILPAVWIASLLSVLAAQVAARLLRPIFPDGKF